ncbi:MAG TPA: hypothetical protein DEH78_19195, partial [Solibacterales bacterium]|nr:hypothetical protein [Bryobacterales bacterium]
MGRSGGARLRDLFRRLGAWRRAGDWDAGLDEEMGFHLAKREERLREAGMAADEARGAARRAFGNPLRLREEARGAWLRPGVEALIQDLSLAARRMRRSPGYTLAGAGTLALAIGVCTAVFTLAHAVLLRPLPFADPDRLVRIYEDLTLRGFPRGDTSPANFRQLQQEARSFSGLTMWHRTGATLTGEGEPERIDGIRAAANFFDVFGVRPRLGRGFRAGDDAPGAPPTVVLSHSLWKRRYGGDWSLIGRTVSIGERPHTVLGAMPENFAYPSPEVQIWLPADLDAEDWSKRGVRYFLMAGRLREGVDIRGAQADLDALAPRFRSAAPDANRDFRAVVVPVREDMAGPARDRLLLLSAAVLLVLLIACANVAHLILSRSIRGAA